MSERPYHLDIFSGIGAWGISAEWAGYRTVGFAECAEYPSRVLKRHWPHVKNYGDVRKVTAKKTGRIDCISASPPCQPYSVANRNRGDESDDRILWPELCRVVEDIRPRWLVGEETPDFANMGLDAFFDALCALGYTCQAIVLPACCVGARHIRQRLWWICHTDRPGLEGYREYRERPGKRTAWTTVPSHLWGEPSTRIFRVADGFSNWPHRPARIQAIGNSIVPQLGYEILKLTLKTNTQ